jgi:hypothetical protein
MNEYFNFHLDTERSEEQFELHPEAPSEGPSAEEEAPKSHRLQRQKFQSRKTFRFRKSRKGNKEVCSMSVLKDTNLYEKTVYKQTNIFNGSFLV